MKVINDLHIGTARRSGTTGESQKALRGFLFDSMKALFSGADKQVLINGDLFDGFSIPSEDLLETYCVLADWLLGKSDRLLYLAAGNHDLSRDSEKMSSFDLLCSLLKMQFGSRVSCIFEPSGFTTPDCDFYVIPHRPNQEIFDADLEAVPEHYPYVFLHANFASPFAAHSDHSLNVSQEQAERLVAKGHTLIFGHEHQAREFPGVVIIGNQFPSSISDCLNNSYKSYLEVGRTGDGYKSVPCWHAEGSFVRVDWRDTHTVPDEAKFIRVEGVAELEEAAEAVKAIGALRQRHKAFVVSNAVNIKSDALSDEYQESIEDVKSFDLLGFLMSVLTPEQAEKVKEILK